METRKRIEPQPPFPVVGFFYGTTEYGDDDKQWYYQHPVSDVEMPHLVFNESRPFEDQNQPGYKGDLYGDKIIESVKIAYDAQEKAYFWVVNTAT